LGYFIAYAVDPIMRALERVKISRPVGVFVVLGTLLCLASTLAVTAIPTVVSEFEKLSTNLDGYIQLGKERAIPILERLRPYLPKSIANDPKLENIWTNLPAATSYISGDTLKGIGNAVLRTLLSGYSLTLAVINVALLPFIVYYLAIDLPRIHHFFVTLVPITRRRRLVDMFNEIDVYVSSFVRGQFIVCTILFCLYAIGLGFVGVDLWLLLAAISGFGNIIPYVGFLVGICLSSLMAIVTFGDLTHVLWVWGVYAVVQTLEGLVITPKIVGQSVGLSPLVVILALFAGGQLFGLLGVFLAVPAAASLRVFVRHSYEWALSRP